MPNHQNSLLGSIDLVKKSAEKADAIKDVACTESKSGFSCSQFLGPAIQDDLFRSALADRLEHHG